MPRIPQTDLSHLASEIKRWGAELGFQQVGITDADIHSHAEKLKAWLAKGFHGDMAYMREREGLRENPSELVPETARVISFRMDYFPDEADTAERLKQPEQAYVSRYALGRDYHKLIRKRLSTIAERLREAGGEHCRAFVDSAPVLERGFAEKAGLGWIGKNSMVINPKAGSWFFLGEIYTDLPLPIDPPQEAFHCGSCTACLDDCPTDAIVAPFQVDARRCISYLTIELHGAIPEDLRPLMGNRIFGCDDCQLVCPWNKFSEATPEVDFSPRHQLDQTDLLTLFAWTEKDFDLKTQGSPIRRIGYARWLRNIAVALGNAPHNRDIILALEEKQGTAGELVDEHIQWALNQQRARASASPVS
ncbi:epoxyqueuosine reductase [Litorivivens lipolytica]|uniref:Epoxyqueuosine reductase n=1 Tax=Litorivivens lipolytica TaxID=1524264 RepID=A0A7W4W6U4_9GAMM|nr:tRNA epoxyqueuosine(34) reductase QueG [Litorivivens lipolytica]MBB3048531.1 epoxyqueuosine reductase [Litorivivens lipolytica]